MRAIRQARQSNRLAVLWDFGAVHSRTGTMMKGQNTLCRSAAPYRLGESHFVCLVWACSLCDRRIWLSTPYGDLEVRIISGPFTRSSLTINLFLFAAVAIRNRCLLPTSLNAETRWLASICSGPRSDPSACSFEGNTSCTHADATLGRHATWHG